MHVGIIMDGNGRWARMRARPRFFGHRAGARALRSIVESAPSRGIRHLTVYAFSADNWKRPAPEVAALMRLFRAYLAAETARCVETGVRLQVIGRRDRLPTALQTAVGAAEHATAEGTELTLRIALDYSGRDAILRAAALATDGETRESFAHLLACAANAPDPVPDVDLLIRTGGEQRLSDFLLWECAYAELLFSPRLWPDFRPADLEAAVRDFRSRDRRFGAVPQAAAG